MNHRTNPKDTPLEAAIRKAWWSGFDRGERESSMGHSRGYASHDVEAYVQCESKKAKK